MPEQQPIMVAGVDGCKAGWFVATTSVMMENEINIFCKFSLKNIFVAGTFAEVLSKTLDCTLVCIDIPIGLSDNGQRQCDQAARKILGLRASSVFPVPIRPCLSVNDYEEACKISFEYWGKKMSKQSYAIMKKIREVDNLMTPQRQTQVREIHPEISFWALNGKKPIQQNKKTIPG